LRLAGALIKAAPFPLQTIAGLQTSRTVNNAQAARTPGAEAKRKALRQAVAGAASNADLSSADIAQPLPLLSALASLQLLDHATPGLGSQSGTSGRVTDVQKITAKGLAPNCSPVPSPGSAPLGEFPRGAPARRHPMGSLSNDRLDQVRLWAAVMAEHEVLTAGLAAARGLHGSCTKGRKVVATLLHCPKQRCSPWP